MKHHQIEYIYCFVSSSYKHEVTTLESHRKDPTSPGARIGGRRRFGRKRGRSWPNEQAAGGGGGSDESTDL
eukprot:1873784-Pleurochrysis_carterae.AAC.4